MRFLFVLWLSGVVFLLLSAIVYADRIDVFGPYQFEKPKGKPVHYLERVSPSGYPGRYYLRVQNGTDEEYKAKSVTVLLDGVEVIDSGDLRASNPIVVAIEMEAESSLEVVLKGQGGNHVTVELFQERDPQIVIEQPLDGENVTSPILSVSGTVSVFGASDFGVSVNGAPAVLDGEVFTADQVVLIPGWNTVTVESFTAREKVAEAQLQVYFEEGHPFVWVELDEPVYIAPAVVNLQVLKFDPSIILSESIRCEGPESVEVYLRERGYEGNFEVPGVYSCLAQVEDQVAGHLEAEMTFRVMALDHLKEVATRRWDSMQDSFSRGDLGGALANISLRAQDKYRSIFTTLADRMERIAMNMQPIEFYRLYGNLALFKVKKMEMYGGQEYEITHELHFQLDSDGIWRLRQL